VNIKRFARGLFVLCLFYAGFSLYAQSTAQEMEALLEKDEITYAEAARFILHASDKFVTSDTEEAFWFAAKNKWLPKSVSSGDPARIDGIALLIMNSFDIEGGFMYSATKSPHYAFRELVYKNIIQGRADRYTKVSGEELIFIAGRALADSERKAELAAKFAEDRQNAERKEHLQPESFDFGLVFSQDAAFYRDLTLKETSFIYRANIEPRFSFLLGKTGFFITSMGILLEYSDEFSKAIELLRTEYSMRYGAFGIRVGRFTYSDPMKFVADNLFDGFQLTHNSGLGQLSLGGWYTGILYKKTANILMTQNDRDIYNTPMAKGEFLKNFFAPPRLMVSLDWEHPSIAEFLQLKAAATGQFDISHQNERLHSQYFTLSAGINFKSFILTAGGSFEAAEIRGDYPDLNYAIAGELGFYFPMPSKFKSQLSLKARYGSGNTGNPFYAFTPITTSYYGDIFRAGISGHTILDLTYSARFMETLGATFTVLYFIRNDLLTPSSYIIIGADNGKKLLGAELSSKVIWSPFSDMQYSLGIGAFIPPYGNNWPNARAIWKINLTTVFALY